MMDDWQRLVQRQEEINKMNEGEEGQQKEKGYGFKERVDRACKANKKAQAETGKQPPSTQPEKAQAPQAQNNNSAGPKDQSMADVRMENFCNMQSKLSSKKSIIPNLIGQCNLFSPSMKGRLELVEGWKPLKIYNGSSENLKIYIDVYQLNQFDLTILLGLYKFIKNDRYLLSAFHYKDFLDFIQRKKNDAYFQRIKKRIRFIRKNSVYIWNKIGDDEFEFEGSFVHSIMSMNKEEFMIDLSKPLYDIFHMSNFSLINMDQRLALGEKYTAQAFHAFLSTHKCPHNGLWFNKERLKREWSDGSNLEMKSFMRNFKDRVLYPLDKIGFLRDFKTTKDAVGVFW